MFVVRVRRAVASRSGRGKRAELASSLPAREEVFVELHEFGSRRQCLLLARQLEYGVAADDFLGLYERAVNNSEFPVRYSHLRAPPRGYRYVRDDRGQVLLVGIATGVILSAIFSNY